MRFALAWPPRFRHRAAARPRRLRSQACRGRFVSRGYGGGHPSRPSRDMFSDSRRESVAASSFQRLQSRILTTANIYPSSAGRIESFPILPPKVRLELSFVSLTDFETSVLQGFPDPTATFTSLFHVMPCRNVREYRRI